MWFDNDNLRICFRMYNHPGEDIPRVVVDWEKFKQNFSTEEDIYQYFFQMKWPDGLVCPRCDGRDITTIRSRRMPLYQCRSCNHQTTLTVNTIMEGTRTPLHKWLTAFFFAARTDVWLNAINLSKLISVTYKTAWSMLNQIRKAITLHEKEKTLSGVLQSLFAISKPRCGVNFDEDRKKPFLIVSELDENGDPCDIRIKFLPEEHVKEGLSIRESGYHWFQKEYVTEGIPVKTRRSFLWIRPFMRIFNSVKSRIKNKYGNVSLSTLQYYYNEMCYYINLEIAGIPGYKGLARLSMSYPRHGSFGSYIGMGKWQGVA